MNNNEQIGQNIRLKYLFTKRIGGAWGQDLEGEEGIVCLRAADIETEKVTHKIYDLTRRVFSQEELLNKGLQFGDLIIEKSGGGENQPVGRIAFFQLNEPALCSNFMELLRPDSRKISPKFGAFLLYSLWLNRLVTPSIKQTTGIQNLDVADYLDNKIFLPPISVQEQIINYLKNELYYIDNLIAQKEQLVSLLSEKRQALITQAVTRGFDPNVKLKNSGIDWLGDIPEHWEIKKMKHITSKIGSGVTPKGGAAVYLDEGIPLLRSQNIHFDRLRLEDVAFISEKTHNDMPNSKVQYGDVLLNITGASIGRCYYYEGQLGEANVNQHVCILRPNNKIHTKYLYLFLSSSIGQYQIALNQVGGGREGLTFDSLKTFIIGLPSIREQAKIIERFEVQESKFNLIEIATKRSIELLKERRIALILAAVTGQIEIPEIP